jgi:parallel beta-helix repeat protein
MKMIWLKFILSCALVFLSIPCYADILTVDKKGGADFTSIQNALNYSIDGDTIRVQTGTYYENIIFPDKVITVTSTDPNEPNIIDTTIIDGNQLGSVVTFEHSESRYLNRILNGFTITNGRALYGGGVYCYDSRPIISNCNFVDNSAEYKGGGIYSYYSFTLKNCTLTSNSSEDGGGMYNDGGSPLIANCVFTRNQANDKGGGLCNGPFVVPTSGPTLVNCILNNNTANQGGAIYYPNFFSASLSGCTLTANTAKQGGAIYWNSGIIFTLTLRLKNCILWEDTPNEIFCAQDEDEIAVKYSDIQGGWPGTGNINEDPLFVDPNDYHLKSAIGRWTSNLQVWTKDDVNSPCIDAGDPNSNWTRELWPHGKRINMGAYGGTPQASMSSSLIGNVADINADGTVNLKDYSRLIRNLQNTGPLLPEDLNLDNHIDRIDLLILTNNWLKE